MRGLFGFIALVICCSGVQASSGPVIEVDIATAITPVSAEIVTNGLKEARDRHASLVILKLDTPGGLMDSMRDIIHQIVASPIPVVAWVGPSGARAASAGFFLMQASDLAAMAPGTNTGAAHPVSTGGQMDPVMKQKVENDACRAIRSLSARHSRNSTLAEQTVLASKSFTEHEALDGHLIELIAANERDLLKQLDGRSVVRFNGSTELLHTSDSEVIHYNESVRERILTFLSDPNIALIFLMLGALGIYAEFNAPGAVFPGVAGSICALLALSALSVLPISALGASLIFLSFLFFGLELKFASHGVLGIGGAVALTLGALLLIDSPLPEMRIRLSTALAVALPFAIVTAFLFSIAARARRNKAISGADAMIGEVGTTVEALNPAGRIFVHGEYWNAASPTPIQPGQPARVTAIHGLHLSVEPVDDKIRNT